MSWDGTVSTLPDAGERRLLEDSMRTRASVCACVESGTWTDIWSPSKSALKGAHTSGCRWMALPSTRTGSKAGWRDGAAWGARLSRTRRSWITSSRTSHTAGSWRSIARLAP